MRRRTCRRSVDGRGAQGGGGAEVARRTPRRASSAARRPSSGSTSSLTAAQSVQPDALGAGRGEPHGLRELGVPVRPSPSDEPADHEGQDAAAATTITSRARSGPLSLLPARWCETNCHAGADSSRRRHRGGCRGPAPGQRGAARAPPALRRLVVPQGQGRPRRARGGRGRPRGRRGDRPPRPARRPADAPGLSASPTGAPRSCTTGSVARSATTTSAATSSTSEIDEVAWVPVDEALDAAHLRLRPQHPARGAQASRRRPGRSSCSGTATPAARKSWRKRRPAAAAAAGRHRRRPRRW